MVWLGEFRAPFSAWELVPEDKQGGKCLGAAGLLIIASLDCCFPPSTVSHPGEPVGWWWWVVPGNSEDWWLARTRLWRAHCQPQPPGSRWSSPGRADTPSLRQTGSRSCCHSVGRRSFEVGGGDGGAETCPATGEERCKATKPSLVLLCQPLKQLPARVGTKAACQADVYQDSVRKARQAGGKGTFLLLSPE